MQIFDYAEVFSRLDAPCLVLGVRGEIAAANDAAMRALKIPPRGAHPSVFQFISNDPTKFLDYLRSCAATSGRMPGVLTVACAAGVERIRCNGSRIPTAQTSADPFVLLELSLRPAGAEQFEALNRQLREHQREAHERRRTELALRASEQAAREAADRTARLQTLTAALAVALTPKQVATVTLEQGMLAWDAIAGGVCLITPDGAHQQVAALAGPGVDSRVLEQWETFPLDAPYPVNACIHERSVITIQSIEEFHARFPEIARHIAGAGYQAYFAAPLILHETPVGCINFNFAEPRTFSDEERVFMRAMASQAALALERARLYEAERQAREAAEAASRAKSQFLGMMSHELRTPLNAIVGYEDLLESEVSGTLNEVQKQYLYRIKAGSHNLLRLINEVLFMARIEAGKVELKFQEVDAQVIMHEAVQMIEPLARKKGLLLVVECASSAPVCSDADKVRQILMNLLSNSVKFTDRGQVTVRLGITENRAVYEVADTGCGIEQQDLQRIFDPFVQVDNSSTRRFEGTGLGLSVCRNLAQLLGADLTVESTVGVGSVFRLALSTRPELTV